jgi:hypothetical protein
LISLPKVGEQMGVGEKEDDNDGKISMVKKQRVKWQMDN